MKVKKTHKEKKKGKKFSIREFFHNPHPILKVLFVLIGLGLLAFGGLFLWVAFTPLPDVNTFIQQKSTASTKIYDIYEDITYKGVRIIKFWSNLFLKGCF